MPVEGHEWLGGEEAGLEEGEGWGGGGVVAVWAGGRVGG